MNDLSKLYNLKLITILMLLFILQSCKPDDIYYNLNNDAKGFLTFNTNDTFKLKKSDTGEILTFTVLSKEIQFVKEFKSEAIGILAYGSRADTYNEEGKYTFTDASNCYNGEVTVTADSDGYELTIKLNGCNGAFFGDYIYHNTKPEDLYIESKKYPKTFLLEHYPLRLYYSKEKGIIKIDIFENDTLFTIVE